jgi:hypothetical protein
MSEAKSFSLSLIKNGMTGAVIYGLVLYTVVTMNIGDLLNFFYGALIG